jgi:hypothetical protein
MMTVIAVTAAMPHKGKRLMAENRARQLGGIYARHGAAVKVATVVSGPNAGSIGILRGYADFRTASKAFQSINNDPAHAAFWQEVEANPAADVVIARDIMRTVYGEGQWGTHPVSVIRHYELSRGNMDEAIKILAKADKIVSKEDAVVVGLVPFTGENLSTFSASYQFRSMDHCGEVLDALGTSKPFQTLVAQASEIGTLRSAIMLAPI